MYVSNGKKREGDEQETEIRLRGVYSCERTTKNKDEKLEKQERKRIRDRWKSGRKLVVNC